MKYCPNCGNELENNTVFCGKCGKKTNEAKKVNSNCQNANGDQVKSKIGAGLLGIFLGALGIHNFYLGYTGKAVAQLLLSVLSCGILSPISGIWGLIEGILILTGEINTDAQGNPLGE